MLNILTRPPRVFFPGAATYYLKSVTKKILGKKRGPDAVLESLKRGLTELGVPFVINAKLERGQTVNVISNIEALKYAIKNKESSGVCKLIAGPNLVILPNEHNSLIASPHIDVILTVSPWVTDLYGKIIPTIIPKMRVWPAGVKIPQRASEFANKPIDGKTADDNEIQCLVFKKSVPENLYERVILTLTKKNIKYQVFEYGKFGQKGYFDALEANGRHFMIYLQESESQGIALQEAWIRDVPTLVWNKGSYTSSTGITVTGNVAAPFLSDEAGMLFKDADDFETALDAFMHMMSGGKYHPREYCLRELTDKISAEIYVQAIGLR